VALGKGGTSILPLKDKLGKIRQRNSPGVFGAKALAAKESAKAKFGKKKKGGGGEPPPKGHGHQPKRKRIRNLQNGPPKGKGVEGGGP